MDPLNKSPNEYYNTAINSTDYTQYIMHLTMAANLGHQDAIKTLTKEYDQKNDYKQDYSITINFYQNTAQYSYSSYYLATMYNNGFGVEQNYEKEVELYKQAVKLGNSYAMNNLAVKYQNGIYVKLKYDKAIKLYNQAIELGNHHAMINLGKMYNVGTGVKQDFVEAVRLYKMSAELGNKQAMCNLIHLYRYNKNMFPKEEIIKYFLEKDRGAITLIFGYDSESIEFINRMYAAETEVVELEKINDDLISHLNSTVDGQEFLERRAEWNNIHD